MEARRSDIVITYKGADISFDLKPYLKSFTFTDCASGEADTISLGIADHEGKWIDAWFPEKTDEIKAVIDVRDWNREGDEWPLDCGKFTVDDVSFEGPPTTLTLRAISAPVSESWNCRKNTKLWEKTTLQSIAAQIAADAGVGLAYEGDAVPIKVLEQSEETDMEFLQKLCDDYGLAMKVYSDRLIIYDEEIYEARATVAKLTNLDVISWSGNTTLTGIADGATVKYKDPKTGKKLTYEYTAENKSGRASHKLHESNEKADSLDDAKRKAKALVRQANRDETTMTLTMDAHKGLFSTSCVDISGFGKFDGKYFIDKVSHNLDSGYTMELELRRVE